ncbi:MAG: cupin domain-containing protein [Eubacteriales bacterium]|nr:cupin domain-containing protein [Eubacteriales bacterium]
MKKMLNRAKEQKIDSVERLRGGEGEIIRQTLIAPEDSCGKFKMCAKLTLNPGCTIGAHSHMPDAEFCWLLDGELLIQDGGEEHIVKPGDAWICGDGASHYTKNVSDRPATFLAVVVK